MQRKIDYKKYVELAYILGDLGRSLINLKDFRSKCKYFQGAEEFSCRDLGRSMHYFQVKGSTEAHWGHSSQQFVNNKLWFIVRA